MANETTDRELLELAAKAAGYKWSRKIAEERAALGLIALWLLPDDGSLGSTAWNPLANDGDALRLAVKLGVEVGNYHQYGRALATIGHTRGYGEFWEIGEDPMAATRRAIVRAAAEIGRSHHG